MVRARSPKSYGIDDLKGWLVPVRAKFRPGGLILCDWEHHQGWNIVFVIDWEERAVRLTARLGIFESRREYEDGLEQTFYALNAARNFQTLLLESDPATRGYKRRLLNTCQQEMLIAGRAAQDLLDAAPGAGEVDEAVKKAVQEIMLHPTSREGEWQGGWCKSQSAIELTF